MSDPKLENDNIQDMDFIYFALKNFNLDYNDFHKNAIDRNINKVREEIKKIDKYLGVERFSYTFFFLIDTFISLDLPYYANTPKCIGDKSAILENNLIIDKFKIKIGDLDKNIYFLASTTFSQNKSKDLSILLENSFKVVNTFIDAYKCITHNHNLRNITIYNIHSLIPFFIYDRYDRVIVEKDYVEVNSHLESDLRNTSRKITQIPIWQSLLAQNHSYFTMNNDSRYDDYELNLLRKFADIFDARCLGEWDQVISRCEWYGEIMLKFYIHKITDDEDVYFYDIKTCISKISTILGISKNKLKTKSRYNDFFKFCQNARNKIMHDLISTRNIHNYEDAISAINSMVFFIDTIEALLTEHTKDESFIKYRKIRKAMYTAISSS